MVYRVFYFTQSPETEDIVSAQADKTRSMRHATLTLLSTQEKINLRNACSGKFLKCFLVVLSRMKTRSWNLGTHGLSCHESGGRHHRQADIIKRACESAKIPARLEPAVYLDRMARDWMERL